MESPPAVSTKAAQPRKQAAKTETEVDATPFSASSAYSYLARAAADRQRLSAPSDELGHELGPANEL